MNTQTRLLHTYFLLLLGFTLLLLSMLLFPADGTGFRLSASRTALLLPVLVLLAVTGWSAYRGWRDHSWLDQITAALAQRLERRSVYSALTLLCTGAIFISAWAYQFGSALQDPYFQGYFSKLSPFILWAVAAAAFTLLTARFFRFGTGWRAFNSQRGILKAVVIACTVLFLLAFIMVLTGIGLKPDVIGWGEPGTPLLPNQVLFLTALALLVLTLRETVPLRRLARFTAAHQVLADVLIFVSVWLLTILLWNIQPLSPNYFAPEPVAPNFEYYPYSDAANYEVSAQELLLGLGFGGNVRRPFYSLFLALAQLVSGVGYANILLFQIPLLALIPPLLYLLGKALHSRLAGVLIAGLAVFHQINAIRLSSLVNVSHAKLLMSDLPTALGVLGFTVVLVYWWRRPRRRAAYPLLAGGILAVTMLIRMQVAVLLPAALLAILIAAWQRHLPGKPLRSFLASTALLGLGMLCVLVPWVWHGQQDSAGLSLTETAQGFQTRFFGTRYSLAPDLSFGYLLPGETSDEYTARMLTSAAEFVREHPDEVLAFIVDHALHNQVSTLLTLPPTYASAVPIPYLDSSLSRTWAGCCSVTAYVRAQPYWWKWSGDFSGPAALPLLFNLFLISTGLAAAWKKHGFAGLFLLVIALTYALGNGIVRSSGWRFNLPADWVGLFYYGIGLLQWLLWGVGYFTNRRVPPLPERDTAPASQITSGFRWTQAVLFGVIMFAAGAAIPIVETARPERYTAAWLNQAVTAPGALHPLQHAGIDQPLPDFAAQHNLRLDYGRILYPRFYPAGGGIPGNAWHAYIPADYPRLGFYLLGSAAENVVLPLQNAPPIFPHGADAILLGCSHGDYIEARMVYLPAEDHLLYLADPLSSSWSCPP